MPRLQSKRSHVGSRSARRLARALEGGSFEGLQDLDLSRAGIGAGSLEMLASSLCQPRATASELLPRTTPRCPSLSQIDLSCNGVGDRGLRQLSDALGRGSCPRLQVLKLAGCGMGVVGIDALAGALASGRVEELQHLDLSGNRLQPAALESLCRRPVVGGHCTGLHDLLLADNEVGEQGATALAAAISTGGLSSLAHLDLSGNRIRGGGMKALADAWTAQPLQHARRLRTLSLAGNELGDGGAAQLARLFERVGDGGVVLLSGLQVLDLSSNGMGGVGLQALFTAALQAGQRLQLRDLDLSHNHLGGVAMEAVARVARRGLITRVTRLNFNSCQVEASGGLALAAALAPTNRLPEGGCPALLTLSLGCNRLMNQGTAALCEALRRGGAPGLTRLTLNGNGIRDDGATALAAAVTQVGVGGGCTEAEAVQVVFKRVGSRDSS